MTAYLQRMKSLPEMDVHNPWHNLREVCKQALLLEDHLFHRPKSCEDCISKHLLTMEALIEEAITLDGSGRLRRLLESLLTSVLLYQEVWSTGKVDAHQLAQAIRKWRKGMVPSLLVPRLVGMPRRRATSLSRVGAARKSQWMKTEDVVELKAALKRELPDIPLTVRFEKKKGRVSIKPTKKTGYSFNKEQATRLYQFLRGRGMGSALGISTDNVSPEMILPMFSPGFDYWTIQAAVEAPTPVKPDVPKSIASPTLPPGPGADLVSRMVSLLTGKYSVRKAENLGAWIRNTFRIDLPRTPRGQKKLKEKVSSLAWNLEIGGLDREDTVRLYWEEIAPQVGNLVKYFTDAGGTTVPKGVRTRQAVYVNKVGLDEKKLKMFTNRLDGVFRAVQGWRRKAFKDGLVVVLAGPKDFRGTAAGTYKSSEDALYVRATPKVLKRDTGSYGSVDYILVHEMGHRYEAKNSVSLDFDRAGWVTTRYSQMEGESFAELFAMGNWPTVPRASLAVSPEALEKKLARFEKVMA